MINKRNIVGIVTVVFMVLFSVVPAFAADSSTQQAQVVVSPTIAIEAYFGTTQNGTITLGSIPADESTSTPVTDEEIRTLSNVAIDLYTRVTGDFTGTGSNTDTIAFNRFRWGLGATPTDAYDTNYAPVLTGWAKAPQGGSNSQDIAFDISAPYGTTPDTYTTTVYFSALQTGTTPPPSGP